MNKKKFVVLFGSKENIYHEIKNWDRYTYCGLNPILEEDYPKRHDTFFHKPPKNHRFCKNCEKARANLIREIKS